MNPMRGFLFSFSAGLALLFSAHGLVKVATTPPPAEPAPANLPQTAARLSVA